MVGGLHAPLNPSAQHRAWLRVYVQKMGGTAKPPMSPSGLTQGLLWEIFSSLTDSLVVSTLLTVGPQSLGALCTMEAGNWLFWALASVLSGIFFPLPSPAQLFLKSVWGISRCYTHTGLKGHLLQKAFLTFLFGGSSSPWSLYPGGSLCPWTKTIPWA